MTTLADLLSGNYAVQLRDIAGIAANLAALVRYGHDQGATHGDITLETVLAHRSDNDWRVELKQPRHLATSNVSDPTDDILAMGRVVRLMISGLPEHAPIPPSFVAAVEQMTAFSASDRPSAAQVERYFAEALVALSEPENIAHHQANSTDYPASLEPRVGEPPTAVHTERSLRTSKSTVLISALVFAIGIGSLGYMVLRAVTSQEIEVATAVPPTAVQSPNEGREPAQTKLDSAEATERVLSRQATEDSRATAAPSVSGVDSLAASSREPSGSSEPQHNHTSLAWAANGWDTHALDDAYCRDGSAFVGLADTDTYRGVVCSTGWGYDYRGMSRAANATIHAAAELTDEGWVGYGTGGVRYEFSEDTFIIRDGNGAVLDNEPVELWLTPDQEPFRPGDLGLTQPVSYPACDGSGVVVHSSHMIPSTNAKTIQDALDAIPGSFYIRTDLSCDNFNRPSFQTRSNGNDIYAVLTYGGDTTSALCQSVRGAGDEAYAYFLAEGVPPGQIVTCD